MSSSIVSCVGRTTQTKKIYEEKDLQRKYYTRVDKVKIPSADN